MRDLATYECNFSDEIGVKSNMLRLHKLVYDSKNKLDRINSHISEEHWIDPKLAEKFLGIM
jgi:hypothetical protein